MRIILSVLSAAIVTAGLLFLMSQLIKDEQPELKPEAKQVELTDIEIPEKESKPVREDLKPPKLPAIEQTPSTTGQVIETAEIEVESELVTSLTPNIEPIEVGAVGLNGLSYEQESAAMPLFRTQPNYPVAAQMKGLEGWVLLKYDVDTSGALSNISVVDAEPRNVFNREAIRALKKWKFKPALTNGQPIASHNQTVKIEFNMEND